MFRLRICMIVLALESSVTVNTMPVDIDTIDMSEEENDRRQPSFISRIHDIADILCRGSKPYTGEAPSERARYLDNTIERILRLVANDSKSYRLDSLERMPTHLGACYMRVALSVCRLFRLRKIENNRPVMAWMKERSEKGDVTEIKILDDFGNVDENLPMPDDIPEVNAELDHTPTEPGQNDELDGFERMSRAQVLRISDSGYGSRIDTARHLADDAMAANSLFGAYGPGRRKRGKEIVNDVYFTDAGGMKRNGGFVFDHGYTSRLQAGATVAQNVVTRNLYGPHGPGRRR